MDDWDLLRAYAHRGAEDAFRELLHRHANMLFSTARRVLHGDAHLAQDVVQRAFCLLAQKAGRLPRTGSLGGWLYRTTYQLARETQRTEWRRTRRENLAATMPPPIPNASESNPWDFLAPVLDEAIHSLPSADQTVLVQRFLQQRSHRDVALSLGISEDAAKMRTQRSLGRLRKVLVQRGISLSTPALAETMWTHALEPVPTGLIPTVENALPPLPTFSPAPTLTQHLVHLAMQLAQTKTRLTVAVGLVLTVGWLALHIASSPPPTTPLENAQPVSAATPSLDRSTTTRPRLTTLGNRGTPDASADLTAAIAQLQAALTDPWPSRRAPVDRVIAALRAFGSDRVAALPMLMETLNRTDLGQCVLAACGLIGMGPDAAEALPEILQMTTTGKLAVLNDLIPKLIVAVATDLSPAPSLIAAMADPRTPGRGRIAESILQLVQAHPSAPEVPSILASMTDLLSADVREVRREAAVALARWPGANAVDAVPVLIDALALERLRDPSAYAPVYREADHSTMMRDLWPATQALVQEIQRSGKAQNPVYDLYLTRMQDLNAVPRARLLDFANALAIDPDLHRLFVEKLTERNPELAAQLRSSP
jgi:RNA polymerase sigma factor (sigma-70 family)